jgi:hypothetical protein
MLFRDIPDIILKKILKKVKRKAIVFEVNKIDYNKNYEVEDFHTLVKDFEELLFDEEFNKKFEEYSKTENGCEIEIEKFKDKYKEDLIAEVKLKQSCKKFFASNFTDEMLANYEKCVILSFQYTLKEYKKSLASLIESNP